MKTIMTLLDLRSEGFQHVLEDDNGKLKSMNDGDTGVLRNLDHKILENIFGGEYDTEENRERFIQLRKVKFPENEMKMKIDKKKAEVEDD